MSLHSCKRYTGIICTHMYACISRYSLDIHFINIGTYLHNYLYTLIMYLFINTSLMGDENNEICFHSQSLCRNEQCR